MNTIRQAFVRNRAEEFGNDIWDSYVLPLYYGNLGLEHARKSVVLQGGRGCGKTALLRYLSYNSQFSHQRTSLPDSATRNIGLYLKADPQYFSAFTGNGLDDHTWQNVFEHALCLALSDQIIGALNALNSTSERQTRFGKLELLDFSQAVGGYSQEYLPGTIKDFEIWLRRQRQTLSRWFRNLDETSPPELFPLRDFLLDLIGEIQRKLPYLGESVFAVYIDEYENLLDYQQRFLNTLMKGGEPPLIFHIAMKPNGMRTRLTTGTEAIQEVGDFRRIILDDELAPDFKLFAAELFFFRLMQEGGLPEAASPVSRHQLQDESAISVRKADPVYRERVLAEVNRILPGLKNVEQARIVLDDATLFKRWQKLVTDGLTAQKASHKPEQFLDKALPEASIVCAALLHQSTKNADDVLNEFSKLKAGQPSRFKEGDWIHHFLVGTLLLIYLPYRQRPCLLYAGFDAFLALSRTNVRHFVELCNLAFGPYDPNCDFSKIVISFEDQARAAFKASRIFKEEVTGCGDLGNRLLSIVNFLGKLFRLSQDRPSQSEPERTHFCITNDVVGENARLVLAEAVKWSVFFEEPESKVKGLRYESSEYILNPIFAPYFGLSYNKGRKLEIPAQQAEIMLTGGVDDFTTLLRQYEKQWASSTVDQLVLGLED
ncbi:hypothetical protein KDX09_37230 [Burkholderia cenocepacia]|uniref:ORC-CDC6 family AAA ATPase n=1 Tax=Burkholderia cenocepacia TaxID=95486 RepID=UPI001B9971EE|nr:hypothetical protein [Burkholderia cenocepacia]MBR8094982.1 hypothetical protein [Burkholderia cenocepacia]